jgi:hypothetical protein
MFDAENEPNAWTHGEEAAEAGAETVNAPVIRHAKSAAVRMRVRQRLTRSGGHDEGG